MRQSILRLLPALAVMCVISQTALADDAREVLNFDKNWKFQVGDVKGADAAAFNDSAWRTLDVPHDYSIEGGGAPTSQPAQLEGPFDPNCPAKESGGYLDAGPAWYRKTFTLPPTARGHRVAIQFDGVYMDSDVYLNGKLLGNHPYGYTSFQYDLTPFLNFDGPNTLAVHINVQQPSSRWYSGAGIYRHVYLNITNPVHIAPWGIYITTPDATDASARVAAKATLHNDTTASADCTLTCRILDAEGKEVATATANATVKPSADVDVDCPLTIQNPRRWSIDSPTLYTLVTEVSANGQKADSVSTRFGVRTIEFTAGNGFLLNGKHVPIQGTCNHHDLGALGSAFNKRAMQRQLELLKEMGCNALRTSHNPPDPELLNLADEMGFIVMDEAFDEWKRPKRKFGYSRFFDDWSERDIVAMIHRDRNHPSIVLWSIGNEIPEQAPPRRTPQDAPTVDADNSTYDGSIIAKRLASICHREDPTRPVTAACNSAAAAVKSGFASALDVFGINYYQKNYDAQKGRPLIASETSSALSTRGEYGLKLNDNGDVEIEIRPKGSFQCTSYDLDKPGWGCTGETDLLGLKAAKAARNNAICYKGIGSTRFGKAARRTPSATSTPVP